MSRIEGIKRCGVFATSIAAMIMIMSGCERGESRNPEPASGPGDDQAIAASDASPRVVCEHVVDILNTELGEQADAIPASEVQQLLDECTQAATEDLAIRGDAAFAETSACVLQAQSMEQLQGCEATDEPPRRSADQLATDRAVCVHVLDIMKQEMGSADATQMPSDAEIAEYTDKCVTDIGEERVRIGDAEFVKQANCIMVASTMESLSLCDEEE